MWNDLGFSANPYDTNPVRGDEAGKRLLVGRDEEIRLLANRIRSLRQVCTVEGPNGVGKTSLVLVAGHEVRQKTRGQGRDTIMLLPQPFQFSSGTSSDDFKTKVFLRVLQFICDNEGLLRDEVGMQANINQLRSWASNPTFISVGGSVAGFGASGGVTPNQSTGFDRHGFFQAVEAVLDRTFSESGGVVCVLDNLEILNTSQVARRALEEMRDDLFSTRGLRWVVCGARGIVKSVASTQRLQGRLVEPLVVQPLGSNFIKPLIEARASEYALAVESTPPVGSRSFDFLFNVLNYNLRDALKFSADFALWIYESQNFAVSDSEDYHQLFEAWLAETSQGYADSAIGVPPRAWRLFDDIAARGGFISPSDNEEFGFNSSQAMRGQIAPLESQSLVNSEIDEIDSRRKTINITAKGWLVQYHRSGYRERERAISEYA